MKKTISVFFAVCAILLISISANAQFKNGKNFIGPTLGLGSYGGSVAFGGMFEAPITHPNDVGPGIIGISGQLMYMSYSWSSQYTDSWLFIGVYGNYHFLLDDRKIDPFIGIGLNYGHESFTGSVLPYSATWFFAGQAGVRYFFSPNMAGRLTLGSVVSFISVGVDFGI
jgi:hypothetical protein